MEGQLDDFRAIIPCAVHRHGSASGMFVNALVDTGSTDCWIQPHHQQQLQLTPFEPSIFQSFDRTQAPKAYQMDVLVDGFLATGTRTFIAETMEDGIDIVLGMNVLRLLRITFRPNGTFLITAPNTDR